ncbi:MAG: hypothetical protein PHW03_00365 [Eubacteriales bacterium]|nr:hypothetical protein [Eubacteriales bacterium]MDD4389234.1 hypothetical protein [Eubacteriales bacterium]
MTNGINFNPVASTSGTMHISRNETDEKTDRAQDKGKEKEVAVRQDGWEPRGKHTEPVTYSKIAANKKASADEIEALRSEADQTLENLRKLVEELILKQTKGYKPVVDGEHTGTVGINPNMQASIEEAQRAISEDGPWGVQAVSDRLVDFAISVSGGDKGKFEELVAAIDEGFAAAKKAWGGELPEISHKTYEETMRKLETWAKGTDVAGTEE